MKNLLDTHTFIWYITGDNNLSQKAKSIIEDSVSENYVSIVSLWEMSIKTSIGKLQMEMPFNDIEKHIFGNSFDILPIGIDALIILSSLPFYHKDPFERLMISQAMSNNLQIISRDKYFSEYEIPIIW